jgi:hypothetical protein
VKVMKGSGRECQAVNNGKSQGVPAPAILSHWAATRMKSFCAVSGLAPLRVTCTVWMLLVVAVTVWVSTERFLISLLQHLNGRCLMILVLLVAC